MKRSATSSTRGRKKATPGKPAATRSGAPNQHRPGGNSSSSGRSNSSSNRTGSAGSSTGGSSGNATGNRSNTGNNSNTAGNRSNANSNNGKAGQRNSMRGNSSATASSARGRESRSTASHEEHFTGESHLEKFFLDQLQDIYYAEHKITQSLPKMAEAATTRELREAFEDHLHQTQRHIKRLEKAFESIGQKAEAKKCEAIEGIAREVEQIIGETEEGTLTRDAALIIAAQKVEHYEIATYGGLVQLAITMELHDAADLLDKTLVEEEDTDARLTEIAENEINLRAEHEDDQHSWNTEDSGSEEEEEEGETENDEDERSSVQ